MTDDESDVVEAMERDEELLSGKVAGLTHEEVMEAGLDARSTSKS